MSIWKDSTSYSHEERWKKKPTCFTARSTELEITVTCDHIYYKGQWVMHCFQLGIYTKLLHGIYDVENAKIAAIGIVKDKLNKLTKAIVMIEQLTFGEEKTKGEKS